MKTPLHPGHFRAFFIVLALLASAASLHATSLFLDSADAQYVQVPANTSLTPAQITLEAWVNVPAVGQLTIVSRGNGDFPNLTDYIFQIGDNGTGNGVLVSFFGADAWDSSTASIPVNFWTHVAVTYDGTNKLFYINGVLRGSSSRAGPLFNSTTTNSLYIGRQGTVCDCNFFNGEMTEVRIWNTVRTASQIQADMSPTYFPQPGLVAYYHLNEGGGTAANDASGNGNTGTLENGASWANSSPPLPPVLGTSARLEGPGAGIDSVVLSDTNAWTTKANAAWLHFSTGYQNGMGGTNVIFSFDANTGPTRTGTLTIAGLTLTITQAGSTYVAAPISLTALVSSGLTSPTGVAVDGAGNVYIGDDYTLKEWSVTNNSVRTLANQGIMPFSLALDGVGDVYMADEGDYQVEEWSAVNHQVTTPITNERLQVQSVAVDAPGNLYIGTESSVQELPAGGNLTTLVSAINVFGVAVDISGNVYFCNNGNIQELVAANQSLRGIVGEVGSFSDAVDGAGNVYFVSQGSGYVYEWVAASGAISTVISSTAPLFEEVAVDGAGNLYVADPITPAIDEQPRALVDPTPKVEGAMAGSDVLPSVLPTSENLGAPFVPTSNQPWLTITGTNSGVVSYSFTANSGSGRIANISLLGESITVTQMGNTNTGVVGTNSLTEGPSAGNDSVSLYSPDTPWTATANATWLHLSATNQSGTNSAIVTFTFDANAGATRTGTLTIAGQTVTVTQEVVVATTLTGVHLLANGTFQFSFTNLPGAPFTVLSTTNVSLPLNQWMPLGAPVESPPGQYQFTGAPATNSQTFYIIRSP